MSDWPESDKGSRVYLGSVGPMLYNESEVLEDEDADDPYFGHAVEGITSEGPGEFSSVRSTDPPTEDSDLVRKQDLDALSLTIQTQTITVMTGITLVKETVDGVEVVTDVTVNSESITFVTDVTLN